MENCMILAAKSVLILKEFSVVPITFIAVPGE